VATTEITKSDLTRKATTKSGK